MISEEDALARGFDAGNYDNAYVSQDLREAWSERITGAPSDLDPSVAFHGAYVLGFFSSYEEHELPGESIEVVQEALNHWSSALLKLGYLDSAKP